MTDDAVPPDPWAALRRHTPARLALGRCGESGLPTTEVLRLAAAHALARDAVHVPLDVAALQSDLHREGWRSEPVHSRAADRDTYLRRPDLGRRLAAQDAKRLRQLTAERPAAPDPAPPADVVLVLGDGLSSVAVARHAVPLLGYLRTALGTRVRVDDWPVVVATQARVALGDEVGDVLGARLVLILLGERPGLSSPDSLGAYLTHAPRVGCHDAQRNCVSNIRPEGLPPERAAARLAWLIAEALRRRLTGIGLKDESTLAIADGDTRAQGAPT